MISSSRPYLIRALYEWILDNESIPHLLVNAEADRVLVPKEFVEEGKIILDISPEAIRNPKFGNELIEFQGRFGDAIRRVSFPPSSVLAIYNEEGIGMFFEESDDVFDGDPIDTPMEHFSYPASSQHSKKKPPKQKTSSSYPYLKIVK